MQSPELFAALTNRSILDQRFASSLSEQTIPFLNEVAKYLRERLAREGNTIASQKRLEKLVADVEEKLTQIYGDIDELYMEEFKALSADEGKFVANAMAAVVVDDVIVEPVANQRLWAAVVKNPLLLNSNNEYVDFRQFVKSLGDNAQKVARSISGGYVLGQTVQEMTQTIVGTRANNYRDGMVDASRRQAEMIVRTSVNHIATQARSEVFKSNDDIVYGYIIKATLDTRTSATCRYYDGMRIRYDTRFQPQPPFHPNCLLPDTVVNTCGGVSKIFKRAYKGIAVDITTETGFSLSVTPNHPILTTRGWLAAKDINRSDKLACITDTHIVVENQKDNIEAKVSDLFSAIEVSSDPSLIADRPTTAKHFHGDVTDTKVSVIDVDSLVWDRVKASLSENVENHSFFGGADSTLNCFGSFNSLVSSCFSSSSGVVSSFCERFSFAVGGSIHSSLLLLGSVSNFPVLANNEPSDGGFSAIKTKMHGDSTNANAIVVGFKDLLFNLGGECYGSGFSDGDSFAFKNPFDWLVSSSVELPDLLKGSHVNGVEFDNVVDVSFREVDTHVYNLENKNNWYVANGIITHNCRTTTVPELYSTSIEETGATRAANFKAREDAKKGTVGQVSAQTQYYELLKRQPKAQQDLVLGKSRGLIFRNSGLGAEEFRQAMTDSMGRPLTLKEMAAENDKILNYMQSNSFLREYLDD